LGILCFGFCTNQYTRMCALNKHLPSIKNNSIFNLEITTTPDPEIALADKIVANIMEKRDPATPDPSLTFLSVDSCLDIYHEPVADVHRLSTECRANYNSLFLGSSEWGSFIFTSDIEGGYIKPQWSQRSGSIPRHPRKTKMFLRDKRKKRQPSPSSKSKSIDSMEIPSSKLQKLEIVGSGSFGLVWKGTYLGSPVAIKEMHKTACAKQSEMLHKECRLWAKLPQHPNICRLIGFVRDIKNDITGIVTEWVQNGSVLDCLKSGSRFSFPQKIKIASQVASALSLLHERKFVHRDIALRNVLIDMRSPMVAKLSDFGMTRVTSVHDNATTSNTVLPIAWAAPECIRKSEYSSKSDVWAYGIFLWELFTEKHPYEKQNLTFVGIGIANDTISLEIPSNWSPALKNLCLSCWSFDPHQRPDMVEICAILHSVEHARLIE